MISRAFITEWSRFAPWQQMYQVEQDLIISRALVELFNRPLLAESLAFRGGTALFKLYLAAARYSEDIDLVQVRPGPMGPIMNTVQEQLNPWLGAPKRKQSEGRVTLTYRMDSEENFPLRLKIEINSRAHFSVLGYIRQPFSVKSRWFSGTAAIPTYQLDELLGTKLRALYQRKKGRDMFDLWTAFTTSDARPERVVACFMRYLEHEGHNISRAEFERNLLDKLNDPRFMEDIGPLLTGGSAWNPVSAAEFVRNSLLPLLPGEPWPGKEK